MAVDVFLKIEGIKGESVVEGHKDEIDILSWNWGATQSGTMHLGPGGGSGKVNVTDLTVSKYLDKATPNLLLSCMVGKHIKTATLIARKAGTKPVDYIKVAMENVLISSVSQAGGDGQDRFTETVTLNFSKVTYDYTGQKEDGSAVAPVQAIYDIALNKSG